MLLDRAYGTVDCIWDALTCSKISKRSKKVTQSPIVQWVIAKIKFIERIRNMTFQPKSALFYVNVPAWLVTKIFWVEKSIFLYFSKMSSNHFLSMNMAWKCVLEALGASFWQFSSGYDDIITPCKNLNFTKNTIFMIFSDFSMLAVLDAKRLKNI